MTNSVQYDLDHPLLVSKFKNIGLAQEDVRGLPDNVKKDLGSGALSPLMLLKIKQENNTYILPAKIKISKDEKTNQPELLVYGVNKELNNSLQLEPNVLNKLKEGHIIILKENEKLLFLQMDPQTRNILKSPVKEIEDKINSVEKILDIELGNEQKKRLQEGKPVKLDVGGEDVTIGVDLRSPNSFKQLKGDLKEWQRQKEIEYDILHPEYLGLVQTDQNRWEYHMIQLKGMNAEKEIKQAPAQVKSAGMKL